MKKLLIIATAIIGLSSVSNAQTGIHVGASFNTHLTGIANPVPTDNSKTLQPDANGKAQYVYPYGTFQSKIGYFAGVVVGYDFLNVLGVQAEINYSNQGGSAKSSDGLYQRTVDLNYLQIPLMLKLTSGGTGSKFYFLAGASYSTLLGAKMTFENADLTVTKAYGTSTPTIDNKDSKQFSSSDFGIQIGMGADIKLTEKIFLNAGLRMYYSLQDLNNASFRVISTSNGKYSASNNAYGGINVGIHYRL